MCSRHDDPSMHDEQICYCNAMNNVPHIMGSKGCAYEENAEYSVTEIQELEEFYTRTIKELRFYHA